MTKKKVALTALFMILAGCAEEMVSAEEAIEISREAEGVEDLLEFDPDASAEAEEGEYRDEECWVVSWYTRRSKNPDDPAVVVWVSRDGRILNWASIR